MNNEGDLQVWWVPKVPMKAVTVAVESPAEAAKLLQILADYDAFQFTHNVKPDYCNAGGLNVFDSVEWCDWQDEDGLDIDAWAIKQEEATV